MFGSSRITHACLIVGLLAMLGGCASTQNRVTGQRPNTNRTVTSHSSPTTLPPTSMKSGDDDYPTSTNPASQAIALHFDFVDQSRLTVSHGTIVASERNLPTTLWLPADAHGQPVGTDLPWVVFLHGYDSDPDAYSSMLQSWARAGYAVAAPTFPLTADSSGAIIDEADMVNEPGDVRFLITQLLHRSAEPGNSLSGTLSQTRIGVAGHSDGANVAFASAYSTSLGDARIRSAIDLSGAFPSGMGPYSTAGPPMLMIHPDQDEYVTADDANELYEAIPAERFWVELHGVRHAPAFTEANQWSAVVDRVTVDFLDLTLRNRSSARAQLVHDANKPRVATLVRSTQ